ncbi:MAG TPA: ribosome small subunit-dependent GTPase A, partial [Tepidisphaeraceae bacterium]|nr:ribosome small subunit-dependent GTPase A [Tepidisphaeraceae bacterium]
LCLNKADLVDTKDGKREWEFAQAALAHYASIGVRTLLTSVPTGRGLDDLRAVLQNKTTVLAGHSGVGKSSLIRAIQPALDLRIGEISGYTGKGRHTTTSACRYLLDKGGFVIDTPGVKLFGLWNVTPDNVAEFFPDVRAGTAPEWRVESYQRIVESLGG